MRIGWVLMLAAAGCATTPEPCDLMCSAAADRMPECLVEWEQSWQDRGYDDVADFENGCATWVWEQEQLTDPLTLDDECVAREIRWNSAACDDAIADAWSSITGS